MRRKTRLDTMPNAGRSVPLPGTKVPRNPKFYYLVFYDHDPTGGAHEVRNILVARSRRDAKTEAKKVIPNFKKHYPGASQFQLEEAIQLPYSLETPEA